MPVFKFKSAFDMPRPERHDGPDLLERIRAIWNRAFALSPPTFSRGVSRFSSIEEANRARFELTVARMRLTSSPGRPQAQAEDRTGGTLAASERQDDPNVEPARGYSSSLSDSSSANFRSVSELLQRLTTESPELVRAADEVDQTLLDRAAALSPLERVEAASQHLADLRQFRPR